MDEEFLFNSNIEIQIDGDNVELQSAAVHKLKKEGEEIMDITEHHLSEEEDRSRLDDGGLEAMQISKNCEKSTAKDLMNIEPGGHSQPILNDVHSVLIVENREKSPVINHVPDKKVLHSNLQISPSKTGGKMMKKISVPILLNGLMKPVVKFPKQNAQASAIKKIITTTSKSQSSLDDKLTVGMTDVPVKKKLVTRVVSSQQESLEEPVIKSSKQNGQACAIKKIIPTIKAQSSSDVQLTGSMTDVPVKKLVKTVLASNQQTSSLEVNTTLINPCIIPGCVIYKNEQVYAFKVPEDNALLNIWDLCIDMKEAKILGINDVICYKHFDESDIIHNFKILEKTNAEVLVDQPHLRKGAMPCIQYHTECCITGCTQTTKKMFTFPILNNNNLNLWLYMVKNSKIKQLSVKEFLRHRVCEIHFEQDCFDEQRELTDLAAPTLFLPVNVVSDGSETADRSGNFDLNAIHCVFRNCESKAKQNGQSNLFSLPYQDFASLKIWLQACERSELIGGSFDMTLKNIRDFGVCNKHFMPQDFENITMSKLKPNALPRNMEKHYAISRFVKACAFKLCYNTVNKIKKLYSFPENFERSSRWLQIMKREDLEVLASKNKDILNSYGVCEDHFIRSDFVNGELSTIAIPKVVIKFEESIFKVSLAFPSQNKKIIPTVCTTETQEVQKISSLIRPINILSNTCIYRGCKSKPTASNPFFSFPFSKTRCRAWLKACGYRNYSNRLIRYQICGKHFKKDAFDEKGQLIEEAKPIQYKDSKFIDPPEYTSSLKCVSKTQTENAENLPDGPSNEVADFNSSTEVCVNKEENVKCEKDETYYLEMLCAVENCITLYKGPKATAHKFPHPLEETERFEMWMRLVGNESLESLSSDEVYRSYVVCERHFERFFYSKEVVGMELAKVAVPTLNLLANSEWLKESVYYQKNVLPHLKKLGVDISQVVSTWLGSEPLKLSDQEDKTRCILERDRLRFPGMGCCLHMRRRNHIAKSMAKKNPYNVYRCSKTSFGPSNPECGENFRIHTAIVIDDDDECEKRVMRYLLHKRKAGYLPENNKSSIS